MNRGGNICAGVSSLLQAFVDGEIDEAERERVADHLVACDVCRTTVNEQQTVRGALREIRLGPAPSALHATLLRELDTIDLEGGREAENGVSAVTSPRGEEGRVRARLGALARGGLVMFPAAAAALALFVLARGETPDTLSSVAAVTSQGEGGAGSAAPLPMLAGRRGVFPTQVSHSPDITLVSNAENAEEATVEYHDLHGQRVFDRQRRADALQPIGWARQHQGRNYYIGTDAQGRMHVEFVIDEVHHHLSLVGRDHSGRGDLQALLEAGHALRSSHVPR